VTTHPAPAPAAPGTVAEMVDYWAQARNLGPLSPATVDHYLGAIARMLSHQGVEPAARVDDLDLGQIRARFAEANPDLKATTRAAYASALHKAIAGYRAHLGHIHPPSTTPFRTVPAPTPPASGPALGPSALRDHGKQPDAPAPGDLDGTVGDLPAFLDLAGELGLLDPRTAGYYRQAANRVLSACPHLAERPAAEADPLEAAAAFSAKHQNLRPGTVAMYTARFTAALAVYSAYLKDPATATAVRRATTPRAFAHPIPADTGAAAESVPAARARGSRASFAHQVDVPLPRSRAVTVRTPPDLSVAEAKAAAAMLRLYHPALFSPDHADPGPGAHGEPGRWTVVFWPEAAPDQPVTAHLIGTDFRTALAAYARTRLPEHSMLPDGEMIDAWYSIEVFIVSVIDGHHTVRDAGALL
jgi:hypothetical protein